MSDSRRHILDSASQKLRLAAAQAGAFRALVGFDGFVDEIISVVDKRYADGHYEPIRTIGAFGDKIRAAAGESTNYELVVKQCKLGGNGPIFANALACLGLDVSYVGTIGFPEPHPAFREFATRAKVISLADPGHTNALEFEDGKIMLAKLDSLGDIHWDNLVERIGRAKVNALVCESSLVGMVNWTMIPRMSEIWEHLMAEVLPLTAGKPPTIFIDLADPEKRTPADIHGALGLVGRFQEQAEVILGLNLKESMQVAAVLNLPTRSDPEATIAEEAAAIREALGVGCVVIHPRRAAAAATRDEVAHFAGPFVKHPKISTGAGDHFNAGFCTGRLMGLGLTESLCAGVATSGYYVRSGESPTLEALAEFVADLPPSEE